MSLSGYEMAPIIGLIVVLLASFSIRLFFRRKINLTLKKQSEIEFISEKHSNSLVAEYKPYRAIPLFMLVVILLSFLFWQVFIIYKDYNFAFKGFYLFFAFVIISQMILSLFKRKYKGDIDPQVLPVAVIIPAYNEDPQSFEDCLYSLLKQTKLPDEIHVVDDGSIDDYKKLKRSFLKDSKNLGIVSTWTKQVNAGKRKAHEAAIKKIENEDSIVVTIDSDGTLDPRAIEEGVKPFADERIMSVAGLAISKSVNYSLMSRMVDIVFVGFFQLIDRASMSRLNSVIVNTGSLAFYRMKVINSALLNGYVKEEFLGSKITISDDSFLTLFGLLNGKAVQQPSSIVFADMPISYNHHVRQQMRWMRGSFIRTLWRFKYLPVLSWAFLRQLLGWVLLATSSIILIILVIVRPLVSQIAPPVELILVGLILCYMQAARYFSIVRSDQSRMQQFVSFCLAPIASMYSTIVLRAFRVYGMMTPVKGGWGTRTNVEAVRK